MNRIKNRIPEEQLLKMVSDEDNAIIDAVKRIFPNVVHSFCVFHQLKNVTLKYLDEFESVENIPAHEVKLYEATTDLILAETVIDSTIYYNKIIKMASEMALYHFPVIFKIRLTPIDANLRQQMRKSVKSASKIITGITGFWNSAF